MSHFLTIPINEHGLIHHQRFEEQLQTTGTDLFGLTDVFLYSQGGCPGGSGTQAEQNALALGFARSLQGLICASPSQWPRIGAAFAPLALPIHWPAPQPEEPDCVGPFRQATLFTALEHRADSVGRHAGYSLLRLMIERQRDGQPYRFNLIGLTPLHLSSSNDRDATDGWSGRHSDINRPQIYELLARFFGQ